MENDTPKVRVGHCKKDSTDNYIGRVDGNNILDTKPTTDGWLGNPYTVSEYGRERCVELFEQTFARKIALNPDFWEYLSLLAGHTLGCWCHRLDADEPACHGDVIARWLNTYEHISNGLDDRSMRLLSRALLVGWDEVSAVELTIDGAMAVTLTWGEHFVTDDVSPVLSKLRSVDSSGTIELVPECARH